MKRGLRGDGCAQLIESERHAVDADDMVATAREEPEVHARAAQREERQLARLLVW